MKTYIEFQGRSFHERAEREVYAIALAMMDTVPKGRVLDLAAGSGYTTARLAAMGFTPKAYDVNTEQFVPRELEFAKANLNLGIPEADASVSGILALELIEHLENPSAFLREAARVIEPGGALVLSTPNIVSLKSKLRFLFRGELQLFFDSEKRVRDSLCEEASGHITPLLPFLLATFLKDAGFDVERRAYTKQNGLGGQRFGRSLVLFARRRSQ